MGSKKEHKHKKDHKHHHKRKHKRADSDERSPVDKKKQRREKNEKKEKSRKRHKHDEEPDSSPDEANKQEIVEEIAVEEEEVYLPRDVDNKSAHPSQELSRNGGGGDESLSIEETNKLREKLGLKPLNVAKPSKDGAGEDEFVHAPAEDLWKKKQQQELREKIQARKEKRIAEKKFSKLKTLGEKDGDESALSWVQKSKQREATIKTEKVLAAAGDEFGLGDLVNNELGISSKKSYTEKDLKGMNVEHSLASFKEGQNAILVIKDKEILGSDDEDVLHSVNIQDKEKAEKNLNIKRRGAGYKAYEEEEVDDMGFFKSKSILGKYDEEIEGEESTRFTIGERGRVDTSWEQQKESMKQEIRAKGESLALPPLRIASEYLTADEMKFKKRKRKVKKVRKREALKVDDLLPLPGDVGERQDHGSRSKQGKIPGWDEGVEITKTEYNQAVEIEENNVIDDEDDAIDELQRALEKSRRAKSKKSSTQEDEVAIKVAEQVEALSKANLEKPDEQFSNTIYLNATDEFCRQLGAQMPVKERVAVEEDIQEVEMEIEGEEEPSSLAQWSSILPGEERHEKPTNPEKEEHAPIEAEPLAANGLMGALKLAERKGYLNQEDAKKGSSTIITNANSHLQAKNYSIEDKNAVDYLDKYAHEKYTKDRSRYERVGATSDFVEKKDYKPKVAIEYVDDRGRSLSAKEAFRKLSHRFHGKGSGKSKQEKRMKKMLEEDTMKHMSSTDTPLNTVAMMKSKLRTESSPYIVLSGAGKTLMGGGGSSLSKK